MVLTLTRRVGERIVIGDRIEVTVIDVGRGQVRLRVSAPQSCSVHRGEVVDRVVEQNLRALAAELQCVQGDHGLSFPAGLLGLPDQERYVLCDIDGQPHLRALVAADNPSVRLPVIDALLALPDYPVERARRTAAIDDPSVAVALVVTAGADGEPSTINLRAPIVIGLDSRRGAQVIVDDEAFGIRAPLSKIHEWQAVRSAVGVGACR